MLDWTVIETPTDAPLPRPLTMRIQTLPPRSYFDEHSHAWGQLVYAISGVLSVTIPGRSHAISPDQAVWLPAGVVHRVGSLLGADFRSLWIDPAFVAELADAPAVFSVGPLMKALIAELAQLQGKKTDSEYYDRVMQLLFDQLQRADRLAAALPWPQTGVLVRLCETLYADPADSRTAEDWGGEVGMSSRTISRRFEAETGMTLRSWRRQMRLFKAIELLGGGQDITSIAFDLGYNSPSAFIYAFRTSMGVSPGEYLRRAED